MKFGFTTTTLRNIRDLTKIVKIAADAKADVIEWGGDVHIKDIGTAKAANKLCTDAGITVSSFGSYYRVGSGNADEWKEICELASNLGADSVRVWLGKKNSEATDSDYYNKILSDSQSICDEAAKYSLIVSAECHDNTFNNNTDAFLKIKSEIQRDNFKTYFQSRYNKLSYDLDRISRTIGYIENVHISFSELRREQFPKHNPEYIDELLKKLIACGFDNCILLEYTYLLGGFGISSCLIKDLTEIKRKVSAYK